MKKFWVRFVLFSIISLSCLACRYDFTLSEILVLSFVATWVFEPVFIEGYDDLKMMLKILREMI